jgi:actin-related protein
MLGSMYKDKFKTGDYVEWRTICRNKNYEETVKLYQGIVKSVFAVDVGSRNVFYAKVIRNGGQEEIVLLSKIRKLETN